MDLESQPAPDMTEITMIENQLIESRKFFVLPRKDRQQKAIQHRTILDAIKNLSQDIITLQHKQSDYHNYFTIQTQLTTRKDLLTNQINDCDIKIADLDDHIQQIPQVNIEPIQKLVKLNAEIHRIIDRLKQYVEDYKISRIQLNDLEQQLAITKNLYDVVSKDLMIHILQTKLPQIEMYINNNLTYVCDYQLWFQMNHEWDALEIVIRHAGLTRDISTLSGGQKTLLRLCRILAIATINRNKCLLLDETINHLDVETVSKVSLLLESFIWKNSINMYLVTHSAEIQNLQIWDNIVYVTANNW